MAKGFTRHRVPGRSAVSQLAARDGRAASNAGKRKSITFDSNRNRVHFIHVPPRSKNPEYWFSERQRMVKKGLHFELEPEINVEVSIEGRLHVGAISLPAPAGGSPSAGPRQTGERAFLEVRELQMSLLGAPGSSDGAWHCVGSVGVGELAKLKVTLPSGMYQLRYVGSTNPLHVFAQAWDLERELF